VECRALEVLTLVSLQLVEPSDAAFHRLRSERLRSNGDFLHLHSPPQEYDTTPRSFGLHRRAEFEMAKAALTAEIKF
jgi:hypothetical protein